MNPTSILIIVVFLILIFLNSQQRFKNQMLCTFRRPNKTKIEKWVPMDSGDVLFKVDRRHIGRYTIDPRCISMQWYTRGVNRLFPVLVPTLDFRWDTPYPLNPDDFTVTFMTPEARQAGWEEHNHIAFAKANAQVSGVKKDMLGVLLPIATIGILILVGYLVYTGNAAIGNALNNLSNQIKLMSP